MQLTRRQMSQAILSITLVSSTARAADESLPPDPDPSLWHIDTPPTREGFAKGPNGQVYWRAYGVAGKLPVVVLHGGPAAGHTYMRPYAALATDREMILYDQSGCGLSAKPSGLWHYSVSRYVAELEALRVHLGYDRVILVGHSWGALLAPAYAAAHPTRVASMVLAGGVAVMSDYQKAATRWLTEMGPSTVELVRRITASGKVSDPGYQAFLDRYYHAHVLRLKDWPDWINTALGQLDSNPVYLHLNGPNEFAITGALSSLDLRPQTKNLGMPVLVTCGEFDEAPPWAASRLAAAFPNARLHPFPGLSHLSHVEDPVTVIAATRSFIQQIT